MPVLRHPSESRRKMANKIAKKKGLTPGLLSYSIGRSEREVAAHISELDGF
jgi:hypothetical protein